MNTDFRIQTGLFTHPKFIKLQRRLGAEGALAFIRFLAFVAQNKPDGNLTNMDEEDIAIASGFNGDDFASALFDVGFLDKLPDGVYCVHDWAEHNPWASDAPARSEKAQAAAHARWEAERLRKAQSEMPKQNPVMPNATNAMLNDASRNATSITEQCPLPNLTLPNQTKPSLTLPTTPTPTPAQEHFPVDDPVPIGDVVVDVGVVVGEKQGGDLSNAAELEPELLLSRYLATFPERKSELETVLGQAKSTVHSHAKYLRPHILNRLSGIGPPPTLTPAKIHGDTASPGGLDALALRNRERIRKRDEARQNVIDATLHERTAIA